MSDLSEAIEADREHRSKRKSPESGKEKLTERRGPSKPGGLVLACGCRWMYSGGAWRHITPHRGHTLRPVPVTDQEMTMLLGAAS
jgi:hypothetical protein